MMHRFSAALLIAAATWAGGRPPEIPFRMQMLDAGANETCALADINRDGRLDIVSGENWYENPSWTKRKFREISFTNNYVDAFSDLIVDVNDDGYPDVVTVSWFAKKIAWWKNPGKTKMAWVEQEIDKGFPNEFALLIDIDNDGNARELLPQSGDAKFPLAWYEVKDGTWVKHVVSPQSYGHGIGAGDINGDGRTDILTPKGWFEAPADPRKGEWKHHPDWDEKAHLSFLHVVDINEDGKADIVTSNAHDYGIFWLEQGAEGKWVKHLIDDSWSQAHALTMVDLNGDGRKDLLTGKRYHAHNGHDPGGREPLGVYWYEYRKNSAGKVEWIRHVVEYGSRAGGGMQIPVADLDGDGDLDFVCAGKSGLFLFENLTKKERTSR